MRFLLIVVVWFVILGGLWTYSRQGAEAVGVPGEAVAEAAAAQHEYLLEITPTFTVEEDPFALKLDDAKTEGIEIRVNGQPVAIASAVVRRGVKMDAGRLENLVAGRNEIYLSAAPPYDESDREHGVRLVMTRDGNTVVDKTLWSSGGSLVSGTVNFELEAQGEGHDH